MAFQGKGILGGFSDKVGNIQGVRRNGKDIIQSLPKFTRRTLGWLFEIEFAISVRPELVIIMADSVSKTMSGNDWVSGALLPFSFGKRIGGVQFSVQDKNDKVHLVLGNFTGDYHYENYPLSIGLTSVNCAIYRFGIRVTPFIKLSGDDSLRLIIANGLVIVFHRIESGQFVCIFKELVEYNLPVQTFFSMKGNNTTVFDVKQGGTSLILN